MADPTTSDNNKPIDTFEEKSFLCISLDNPVRRAAIRFITWKWFERLSILMILANCVALGLVDPCDMKCRKPMCATLQIVEDVISAFFAVEMLIKMFAMGIIGKKAYLGESWNRFDCFIVIAGTSEYIFADQEINLSAIRAIRVLRPLRAINRISSLRLLVTLLLDIMPMLGNVLIFCFFVFFVFGIIAVQLWAGMFRHRCFFPKYLKPPPFMPEYYRQPQSEFVCSPAMGELQCSSIPQYERHNSMCADLFGSDDNKVTLCRRWVGNYTDCRPDGPNPARGTMNFDSIGFAWIAIFQVISLESWTEVMYMVQDSFSYWAWVYFISLVLVGSYLAVNLSLVVIATQFSETKIREAERKKRERMEEMSVTSSMSRMSSDGLYTQIIDLIYHCCRVIKRKVFRLRVEHKNLGNLIINVQAQKRTQCPGCRRRLHLEQEGKLTEKQKAKSCDVCGCDPFAAKELLKRQKSSRRSTKAAKVLYSSIFYVRAMRRIKFNRRWLRRILETDIAVGLVAGAIILNALVMALEHHNQPQQLTSFIETMNLIFTVVFVTELVVKIYAFGFDQFIREAFNLLDLIVIVINIAELFHSLNRDSSGSSGGSGFAVLRLFRLVRIVKIIRFLPALQKQLFIMFSVVDHVATFFLLLGFFLFISSLLGMSLFGCKFCEKNANAPGSNASDPICRYQVMPIDEAEEKPSSTSPKPLAEATTYGCSIANFDSPFQAVFTVLQVFTQDDWGAVMQDGMHYTSSWAGIYFIVLVTVGNYIIFNLLVAILVEGFSSASSEAGENAAVSLLKIDNAGRDEKVEEMSLGDDGQPKPRKVGRLAAFVAKMKPIFTKCWETEYSDRSLLIFPNDEFPRKQIQAMFKAVLYDKIFLVVILGSCSLIVIERPGIGRESLERKILTIANYIFTAIFLLEATFKVIAAGFCLGKNTYIRSAWNVLDLFLLTIAIVDISLDFQPEIDQSNKKLLQALRVLRLLRALRPLRIISRSKGLQIVLQTLMVSIKPIGNIILICCFFFLIFAILGVQLFSGCYARCLAPRTAGATNASAQSTTESYSDWAVDVLSKVKTRNDCLAMGLEWEVDGYNFNSLPEALMALFVFATLDGWTDITRAGVDCVGTDRQPIRNYNMWAYGFFIAFLLVVCFFALNMFVGVVVNNFQSVQRQVRARYEEALRKNKEEGIVGLLGAVASKFPSLQKRRKTGRYVLTHYSPWRRNLYRFVTHKYFEYVVIGGTVANVAMMTVEFYMMPLWMQQSIAYASYVFLALLAAEVILKGIAFGPRRYVANRWNQTDVAIVILSLVGIILEELPKDLVPVNPAIVTFPRVFRIVRILKLLKSASGVRKLLETLSEAIPQVINLSLLFFLIFFIYASLGVELYGRFDCNFEACEGLSRHANFQHFGMALLTLFRIFTGDNWNGILKDVLWMSSDPQECSSTGENAGIACGIIHVISPAYFVSFVLLAQFVLINVVVAVLMSQLEDAHKRVESAQTALRAQAEPDEKNKGQPTREILSPQISRTGSCVSYTACGIEMHAITSSEGPLEEESLEMAAEIVPPNEQIEETFLSDPDAVSVASRDFVVQHADICDAEYLALRLRSLTTDSDSAVVSDITMSPLTSPGGSPVRIIYRYRDNETTTATTFHSSLEHRQPSYVREPRSSLDMLDGVRMSPRNAVFSGRYDTDRSSHFFSMMVPTNAVEVRRAKFAGNLPAVPESPSSVKDAY